jgi:hypothetical protein
MVMEFAELEALIVSKSDREQGIGASADEILLAERVLDVQLSGGYRKFLERFGWLAIGPDEIYGLGKDVPRHLSLADITLSEWTEMRPRLRRSLIPVLNDGGGNLYCIDTSAGKDGVLPMVFWDHELDANQVPEIVSPSFEDWLGHRVKRG